MTVVMSEACGRQMDGLNRRGNPATVARRGKLMAVEIKATPTAFDRGAPQALFDLRSIILPQHRFYRLRASARRQTLSGRDGARRRRRGSASHRGRELARFTEKIAAGRGQLNRKRPTHR
jgi:hypothetical protein